MKILPGTLYCPVRWVNAKILTVSLIFLTLVLSARSQNKQERNVSLPPVETEAPISKGQKPAFKGQTRIGGIKTKSIVKIISIASGLHSPWGLDFMPDGRMIVSERPGNIRIVSRQGAPGPAIQNVPPVRLMGDGGMYDLKLDPDFGRSRLVFWTFVEP